MKYRPEIDGLRALAVVPVIFVHAGFEIFSGGFIGVDIFFVISGYLITSIIIEDIEKNKFSITNFYERRARRILPALFFVMLICIPFSWAWMLPDPLENFGQSLVASVLFVNNILLVLTSGYWDLASEFKPLLHTWSLGVEEQYYIFFPLFLIFVWKFAKKYLLVLIFAIAALSLALSEYGWREYPTENFYLITTRAWELFVGALVAMRLRNYGIKGNNFLSMFGFLAILFSILVFNENTPFPSIYALVPVLGVALIILYADKNTFIAKWLSKKLLVGIGLVSYSAYLWHQPLLSFSKIYSKTTPTLLTNFFLILFTFFLAILSWQFIEKPFRKKGIVSKVLFSYSMITVAIVIIIFGYSMHTNHGFVERVFDDISKPSEIHRSYNDRNLDFKQEEFTETSNIKILIIGNSSARDIINVIRETYNMNKIDLIYRDDLDVCTTLNSKLGVRLFEKSNLVIYAGFDEILYKDRTFFIKNCINSLVEKSNKIYNKLYFVGNKNFGNNLNWIVRIQKKKRSLLRNKLSKETLETEELLKSMIPTNNYISILHILIDENNSILITDNQGRLISPDRDHLTRYGAIYVGENLSIIPAKIINK